MNADQITEARALATVVPHNIAVVDVSPWMVAQYVPSLGTGAAAATMQVLAGTLRFKVDAATPAGADAIGTDGEFDLSTADFNTMGELVDAINGVAAYRAYLVGALRADLSTNLLVQSATSIIGDTGLTVFGDTSGSKEISLAISGEAFVNNGKNGHLKDSEDGCENSMMYAAITVTNVSLFVLRYYTGKQGTTEVQVGQDITLTSATLKEQGEANLSVVFVTSARGERLIVRVIGLESVAPSAPSVHVLGKTAVLANDRVVTSIGY